VGLQYHFGIAKAVAHIAVLLEYFAPLIKIDGQIYLPKGASAETEIGEAVRAAKIFGFELDFVLENEKDRAIVSYKKKRNPEIDLPRKMGEAKHRPIM
jgi:16S rRNA (guanine527-N7)-methyltransferase